MNLLSNDIFVIIPARNEGETLPALLLEITSTLTQNVVVVDNNSSDQTFIISKSYSKHVIKEPKPGYGNACLAGIKYINQLPSKPNYVCFFDGDGQSLVSDIYKIIQPLQLSNKINYCQGTRMISKDSKNSLTGSAYVANKIFSFILTKIWRQKITDLGPLRCIKLNLLNELQMSAKTYAWTIEMNTKLLKMKEPLIEIPVGYKVRKFGESKISGSFKTALIAASIMSINFLQTALFWKVHK